MTQGAKSVLEALESLSDEEREEVLTELLRRAAHGDHPSLSDQELVEAVDTVFTNFSRSEKETNNGNGHHL